MWQFIKGCVIIRVNGRHPERLLNLMREHGLPVRRVCGAKRDELQLTMHARDFRKLRPLMRKANCRAHILTRRGAPFALNRLWRRPVLWAGVLLASAAIALASTRVMHIEVTGCVRVPEALVLRALEEQGLRRFGAYPKRSLSEIAMGARLYDERIAWLTLMLQGSRLVVNVTETEPQVVTSDPEVPCDVVAVKDGILTDVAAYTGYTNLAPGDRVLSGDVLIAGEFFPDTNEEVLEPLRVHARGRVLANVYYYAECAADLTEVVAKESGNTAPYRRVAVCGIVLYESPPPFALYEVQNVRAHALTDSLLPVEVLTAEFAELTMREEPVSRARQIEEALCGAERLALLKIPKDAVIVDKQQRTVEIGGVTLGIVGIVTEESIGLEREIVY